MYGGMNGGGGSRVFRLNDASEPAAGSKLAGDLGPDWSRGFYDVVQDTVDRVFVKDADISVRVEIHFQRL